MTVTFFKIFKEVVHWPIFIINGQIWRTHIKKPDFFSIEQI